MWGTAAEGTLQSHGTLTLCPTTPNPTPHSTPPGTVSDIVRFGGWLIISF